MCTAKNTLGVATSSAQLVLRRMMFRKIFKQMQNVDNKLFQQEHRLLTLFRAY